MSARDRKSRVNLPTATYRLQFRQGMDFTGAAGLAPYLRDLGISHLYASPIFTAVSGSTHGYDVTDCNEIDPALGGRAAFDALVEALHAAGMGLILDIVPNHMAASLENRWWRSVVERGSESPYARHFDVDWTRRLTLPVLGGSYEEVLAAGDLQLGLDAENGALALCHFDNRLPLHPASWAQALEPMQHTLAQRLRDCAARAGKADEHAFHEQVRAICQGQDMAEFSEEFRRFSTPELIDAIHARQPWELICWKEARRTISYRRFFEVAGLVGLRVEDPNVFDAAHRLTLKLVREGMVDGLRIDHIDGLADPSGYLRRLREAVGPDVPIWVEKIVARGERLPEDWPIQGTTGYEFIDAISGLMVDQNGFRHLSSAYDAISGGVDHQRLREQAKRQIVTINFEAELNAVTTLAVRLLDDSRWGPDTIRTALAELLVAMPVYRIYTQQGAASEQDRGFIGNARALALQSRPDLLPGLVGAICALLTEDAARADAGTLLEFRRRFGQLSGPAMAKGIEDTLFYRDNRFLALNEVGGDPGHVDAGIDAFHRRMARQSVEAPHSLNATATHDTKRGEDARARLLALSETAETWCGTVERWRELRRGSIRTVGGQPAPEPEVEWLIYQALAGVWPEEPTDSPRLRERFAEYLQKALREAKVRTDWSAVDQEYEAAVQDYADALLNDPNFTAAFSATLRPAIFAGWHASLAQTLAKLTAPGIPDFYQGTEVGDFSLVDPDNRRLPDFDCLQSTLWQNRTDGFAATKQRLIARALHLRREMPALFCEGAYVPLEVDGPARDHLVVFARRHSDQAALVVLPRLVMRLMDGEGRIPASTWSGATIRCPDLARPTWRDALHDRRVQAGETLAAERIVDRFGLALLVTEPSAPASV